MPKNHNLTEKVGLIVGLICCPLLTKCLLNVVVRHLGVFLPGGRKSVVIDTLKDHGPRFPATHFFNVFPWDAKVTTETCCEVPETMEIKGKTELFL